MARQDSKTVDIFFFLCNGEEEYDSEVGVIKNSKLPGLIKTKISAGEHFKTHWSCSNSKQIEVGARAYLLRTGSAPRGVIAAGHVIAAPPDKQLLNKGYSDLSEAYIDDQGSRLFVYMQFDSVVDFGYPLEQKNLKKLPQFQGVNFFFAGGGAKFAPSHLGAVQALESEWEKHSLFQQGQGRGRRL